MLKSSVLSVALNTQKLNNCRLEIEKMFSDGRRHQSAEGEISADMGMIYDGLMFL